MLVAIFGERGEWLAVALASLALVIEHAFTPIAAGGGFLGSFASRASAAHAEPSGGGQGVGRTLDVEAHQRLEQHRPAFGQALAAGPAGGDLEGQDRAIDVVAGAIDGELGGTTGATVGDVHPILGASALANEVQFAQLR